MLLLFGFLLASYVFAAHPVNELDVSKYVGNWYQVYGAPTNYVFQGYGTCATAQYGVLAVKDHPSRIGRAFANNVSVLNSQVNRLGELEQIAGYAFYENEKEPGELSVVLEGVPVVAPYWVMQLGEVVDGQYQYSIVSAPSLISLWVLARDVGAFFPNTMLRCNNIWWKMSSSILAYRKAMIAFMDFDLIPNRIAFIHTYLCIYTGEDLKWHAPKGRHYRYPTLEEIKCPILILQECKILNSLATN